jgi:hypothetical protein
VSHPKFFGAEDNLPGGVAPKLFRERERERKNEDDKKKVVPR